MRVYLSGGSRQKKAQLQAFLQMLNSDIEVIRTGKADYIVLSDPTSRPSAKALATGGAVFKWKQFVRMLDKEQTSRSVSPPRHIRSASLSRGRRSRSVSRNR